jgi:hypothetical protein
MWAWGLAHILLMASANEGPTSETIPFTKRRSLRQEVKAGLKLKMCLTKSGFTSKF